MFCYSRIEPIKDFSQCFKISHANRRDDDLSATAINLCASSKLNSNLTKTLRDDFVQKSKTIADGICVAQRIKQQNFSRAFKVIKQINFT
jgi:hypothetical protein